MQRLTITVDDEIADHVRRQVEEGRAPSISAWVSDAMRQKALARIRLELELDHLRETEPYDDETIAWIAQVIGESFDDTARFLRTPIRPHTEHPDPVEPG